MSSLHYNGNTICTLEVKEVRIIYKISRVKQDYRFEMMKEHYHDYYEFYYLVEGTRSMFMNDKVYSLHEGDLVLIPRGMIHRTSYLLEGKNTPQICERIALCFDDECIQTLIREIGYDAYMELYQKKRIHIPNNRRKDFEDLCMKLLEEYKSIDEYSDYLCKKYCEEINIFAIRCQKFDSHQVEQTAIFDEEMLDAVHYINEHFMEEITLHKMAVRASMSDSYFSKRFRLITGFGYKEYLNTVRIRHACKLLLSTNLTVTEISEACGYMDSNYFGDAFKKIKNISPRDYRKSGIIM